MIEINSNKVYEGEILDYHREINVLIDEIYENLRSCKQNSLVMYANFEDAILDVIGNNYFIEKVSLYLLGHERYYNIFETVMIDTCKKLNVAFETEITYFYFYLYILSRDEEKLLG